MTKKQAADEIADYLEDVKGYEVEMNYGIMHSGGIIIYARNRMGLGLMEALELEDDLNQGGLGWEIEVLHQGNNQIQIAVD